MSGIGIESEREFPCINGAKLMIGKVQEHLSFKSSMKIDKVQEQLRLQSSNEEEVPPQPMARHRQAITCRHRRLFSNVDGEDRLENSGRTRSRRQKKGQQREQGRSW